MTLIVGILCSDGAVVASDSFATYAAGASETIGQQLVDKVLKLGDGAIYASSGAIGVAQILAAEIEKMEARKAFSKPPIADAARPATEAMTQISNTIRQIVLPILQSASTSVPLVGAREAGLTAVVKSLVAVAVKKKACLFQFDHSGAPEEVTPRLPFVALGSGQPIADPFLAFLKRILWEEKPPTVAEGRLVATWTITHVCKTNFGGVGPPVQLATLAIKADGSPAVTLEDPGEHDQAMISAEAALRDHVRTQGKGGASSEPPKPPVS